MEVGSEPAGLQVSGHFAELEPGVAHGPHLLNFPVTEIECVGSLFI